LLAGGGLAATGLATAAERGWRPRQQQQQQHDSSGDEEGIGNKTELVEQERLVVEVQLQLLCHQKYKTKLLN
jgi:hypothetical protein